MTDEESFSRMISDQMDAAHLISEMFSGVYRSLIQQMPEDLAQDTYRYLLDSQRTEQEAALEKLRLRVAQIYKEQE